MKNENQSDMKISQPRLGKGGMIALITACVSRPFATTILLNLQRQDSGSASALINFTFTLAGAVGMLMITSLWNDYILGLSMLCVITGVIGTVWSQLLRKTLSEDALTVPEE